MPGLPGWLNPFDVLIALALLGGIALGFIRGMIRMALNLIVVYVATVVAMSFYEVVGRWIFYLTDASASESLADALAFLALLILTAVILSLLIRFFYKDTEFPGLRQIDQLGGLVIGFFLTAIWIGLALVAIAYVLGTAGAGSEDFRENVLFYFRDSALIPIFYNFLPIAFATLKPWLPQGQLPEILTFRIF
jgi:uncharacterized membrane protein required for colicin V production